MTQTKLHFPQIAQLWPANKKASHMSKSQTRRSAIKTMVAGAAALTLSPSLQVAAATKQEEHQPTNLSPMLKGNINHSACQWCYGSMSLDDLCVAGKAVGLVAIDLIGPKGWDTLKKHGLYSSMCNGAEINLVDGWNEPKNHEQLIKNYTEMIPKVAEAGYKNLICFSGSRRGMDDMVGMKNCAA
jgi:hydroxypyruvate isomerase